MHGISTVFSFVASFCVTYSLGTAFHYRLLLPLQYSSGSLQFTDRFLYIHTVQSIYRRLNMSDSEDPFPQIDDGLHECEGLEIYDNEASPLVASDCKFNITDTGSTSSSWHVCSSTLAETSAPVISQLNWPKTVDRDVQESRWRLTRTLYSAVQNPWLRQPWEKKCQPFATSWPSFLNRRTSHEDPASAYVETEPEVKRPKLTFAAHAVRNMKWEEHEDLLRQQALVRWRVIIEENLLVTNFGKSLHELFEDPKKSSEITMSLQDVFERKATATLAKRAGAIMKYILWSRKMEIQAPMNLTESKVYKYVCHLRDAGEAATVPRSFIEALSFAQHTVGLSGVEAAISGRVRGCVSNVWKKKRPLKQAVPLPVEVVYALEKSLHNGLDEQTKLTSGFFLFCIFSCCRFSDAMRLHDLHLDHVPDAEFGYVEAKTLHHKVGNTDERRTTFLPMVALSWGLHEKAWGPVWLALLKKYRLPMQHYVLPAPLRSGGFSDRPLTVGEGSMWLRQILREEGIADVSKYTVHGFKATGLSWCAKGALSLEDRRMLGHHLDGPGTSALTYSRDALAGPLTRFARIVQDIRNLKFHPDQSRASRSWQTVNVVETSKTTNTDVSSSSSSDSSSEQMEEEVVAHREMQDLNSLDYRRKCANDNPCLFVHCESGLGHLKSDVINTKFKCGKRATATFVPGHSLEHHVHMCLRCSPPAD